MFQSSFNQSECFVSALRSCANLELESGMAPKMLSSAVRSTTQLFTRRRCVGELCFNYLKNGPTPASFSFIFGLFQTNNTICTANQCEKISIQYTAPGYEPTTSQTCVVSHNH